MFKNIPLPESMTKDFIDTTPDTKLTLVILSYIAREFREGDDPEELFSRLPKGYKYVSYVLNILNAQIFNGGFNQFFFNGYDATIAEQLEALALFKADKHKAIFERAIKIYEEEKQNNILQEAIQRKHTQSLCS